MDISAENVRGGQSPLAPFCWLVGFNTGGGRGLVCGVSPVLATQEDGIGRDWKAESTHVLNIWLPEDCVKFGLMLFCFYLCPVYEI